MDRYYQTTPAVPQFIDPATPFAVAVQLEDVTLVDIEIIIPTGHMALTGIRVLESHQQILPWANLSWITGDGYSRVFEVNHDIGANAISLEAYNTDFFTHTFYVRFHLRDRDTPGIGGLSPNQAAAQGLVGMSSALPF